MTKYKYIQDHANSIELAQKIADLKNLKIKENDRKYIRRKYEELGREGQDEMIPIAIVFVDVSSCRSHLCHFLSSSPPLPPSPPPPPPPTLKPTPTLFLPHFSPYYLYGDIDPNVVCNFLYEIRISAFRTHLWGSYAR